MNPGCIDTRDSQRNAHLRSADFFDVEKFPTLHFQSTGINIVITSVLRFSWAC
jgi:polyisoprenoid-binding protein YceI